MNHVAIIGRMVRDVETKTTPNGTQVGSFSLACDYKYTSNGEKKDKTSFFNCIVWGKQAENMAQYVKKGHRVGIEGRLQQRSWDDSEGKKRSAVEIVVEKFHFLQPKSEVKSSITSGENLGNPFDDSDAPF